MFCITYILPLVGIWQSPIVLLFFSLYYFLFVVNRQWKVNNRVAIFPTDSYTVIDWLTLSLSQIDPHILISLQPIFHRSVMRIRQKRNIFKRKNVIPHVRYAIKLTIPCSYWCESDYLIQKFTTQSRKLLDSTITFKYPGRLSQEKYLRRWEGFPKHVDTTGREGECHLTTPHSTSLFSGQVKEDKMGDLLSDT